MIKQAKWIRAPFEIGTTAPEFFKAFTLKRKVPEENDVDFTDFS